MSGVLGAIIGIGFWVGVFVSQNVFRVRAGVTKSATGVDWREFLIPNVGFFVLLVLKSVVWPVVLVVWLCLGTPPSPWRTVTFDGTRERRKIMRVSATNPDPGQAETVRSAF